MTQLFRKCALPLAVLSVGIVSLHAAQPVTEITLPGSRLFTESITSTKDGTLFAGSVGNGTVTRIPHGSTTATEFIKSLGGSVYGIYADEKHATLWVCDDKSDKTNTTVPSLKAFDLKTAAPKGSYTLPGDGAFCNDIAVASDGTAYVTDTGQGTLVMLKPGATDLVIAAKDPLLAGDDGLSFSTKSVLYVNSVTTGKLVRVDLGHDGKSAKITDLTLSRALSRPDGMRSLGKNRLLLAENSGNMDIVTVTGDTADVKTIKEGLEATPAVTATRGQAWIAEGKLNYRSNAMKDKDPGPFKLYAVPLPKN
jgi:sugar lactone lactonase YvrE